MWPVQEARRGLIFLVLPEVGRAVLFFRQLLPSLGHRYEASSLASRNQIGELQALVRKPPIFFCSTRHDPPVRPLDDKRWGHRHVVHELARGTLA